MQWRAQQIIKRAFELVIVPIALILAAPMMVVVALLVLALHGRPIIFRTPRVGRYERVFYQYKFRSMSNATGADGKLLSDAERLTPFGKLMRSLSLDELPQLFNVLKGDMSIVGPRPLPAIYMFRYDLHERRRHDVRPGLTGLAQVRGRNALSWPQKLSADIEYVENFSLWLDAKIVAKTVGTLVRREGISAGGHATAPEFMGSSAPAVERLAESLAS